MNPGRTLLRPLLTAINRIRRMVWRGPGVLAVPLTPEGRVVLVRLSYAKGWRLPGGGIDSGEQPREAALRELAEEIGMTAHGAVAAVDSAGTSLFLVRDVIYSPRRSFEVEQVAEFPPDALPPSATPRTRRNVADALRRA